MLIKRAKAIRFAPSQIMMKVRISYNIEVAMPIRDQDNGVIIGIVKTGYSIMNLHSVSKD